MSKDSISITFTKNEGKLYDFLAKFKNEDARKIALYYAIELSEFCIPRSAGPNLKFETPEGFKKRIVKSCDEQDLYELKDKYLHYLLKYLMDFNSDEVQEGIIKGIDDQYWYIQKGSRLPFISLYANYLNVIDELISEKNSANELDRYECYCDTEEDENLDIKENE